MSRKNKRAKTSPAKPLPPHAMDGVALATQAEAELVSLRYKEAIELYKELLKRERRPEWVDGLAAGYAGRAWALADKGMFKEALVLWRNRHQLCGKPLLEGPYLDWLVQAGEEGEVLRQLADRGLPDALRAELETRFAGLVLTAADDALPDLPVDSPLLRHRPAAREALAAYHRGDFSAMGERLQAIPFRSPFRDLKPVLKALALLQADGDGEDGVPSLPEGANERFARQQTLDEAINRLPVGGPFAPLAAVLRAAVLPEAGWLAALGPNGGLDEGGRQLLLDLKGCPEPLRPLLLDLAKLNEYSEAETLFDLLLRHRRALPEGVAAGLCRRLLPHAPKRLRQFTDAFGGLPEEAREHLFALTCEVGGGLIKAAPHWTRMAHILGGRPADKLRAALILRHLASRQLGGLDKVALERLKQSLDLDPEDRESYLSVIGALRSADDLQQARAWLDRALARFPKDAGVLLEALEVALAGKAFKKAVGLAKQVLELDPINPRVRASIGHAHLSHARKQIKAGNHAAADKELDAAGEWLRAPVDNATLELLRAISEVDAGGKDDLRIRAAVAAMGGDLVGGFQLLLEAGRLGFDPAKMLRYCEVDLAAPPAAEAVVAFAHALNAAPDGEQALRAALRPLQKALTKAAKAQYSESDLRLICEALQRRREYTLLNAYAQAALKRWPGKPVFVYYKMVQHVDRPYMMPDGAWGALQKAAKDARQQGDHRTAQRIDSLLRPAVFGDPFFDEEDDDEDAFDMPPPGDERSVLEMMLKMGGAKALLEMARQAMGKRAYNELRREFGGDDNAFARFVIEMTAGQAGPSGFPLPIPPLPDAGPTPRDARRPPSDIQKDLFDD